LKLKSDKFNISEKKISIAEAKNNFSEYISRAAYMDENIIITKRGKPVAGLVSCKDLEKLKAIRKSSSLKDIVGKWKNFEEIEGFVQESFNTRIKDKGRNVSF